jgi:hypothetical protein
MASEYTEMKKQEMVKAMRAVTKRIRVASLTLSLKLGTY